MEGSSPTRTADTRAGVGADGDAAASATSASVDAAASGSDDEGGMVNQVNKEPEVEESSDSEVK